MRLHHTGIIVSDIAQGGKWLANALGCRASSDVINDPLQRVFVQFFQDIDLNFIELIAPASPDAPVSNLLSLKRNLLNHFAYEVVDLRMAAQTLRENGCIPLGEPLPAAAFGGRHIQFFLTPLSFVVELIEQQARMSPDVDQLRAGDSV